MNEFKLQEILEMMKKYKATSFGTGDDWNHGFDLMAAYRAAPYTTSIDFFQPDAFMYKFESPNHFIAVLEELQASGKRNQSQDASEKEDASFCGSSDIEEAFEKFRTAEFDQKFLKQASVLVNQMRQRMTIAEDGDEILVQEFLAKSDYFVKYQGKKYKRLPILDIPIFIQCTYPAFQDQQEMYETAKKLIASIYQLRIKCPKIVFMFVSNGFGLNTGQKFCVFIECNTTDFNSFSKMLLPSTFRRLIFRVKEMFRNLPGGYGQVWEGERILENGIVLQRYVGMKQEDIKADLEKMIKDYALRSSMARNKNITA